MVGPPFPPGGASFRLTNACRCNNFLSLLGSRQSGEKEKDVAGKVVRADITLRSDMEGPQTALDVLVLAICGAYGDEAREVADLGVRLLGILLRRYGGEPEQNGHISLADWSRLTGFYG